MRVLIFVLALCVGPLYGASTATPTVSRTPSPTVSCTPTPSPNKSVTPVPVWTATPAAVYRYFSVPTAKGGVEPNMDISGMSAQYTYSKDRTICYVRVLTATAATLTRLQAVCTPATSTDFGAAIMGTK